MTSCAFKTGIACSVNADDERQSLIEFPSDFPIKVVGVMSEAFEAEIEAIAGRHDPEYQRGRLTRRESGGGKYLALTLTIRATSLDQLDALYRELSTHPAVKFCL